MVPLKSHRVAERKTKADMLQRNTNSGRCPREACMNLMANKIDVALCQSWLTFRVQYRMQMNIDHISRQVANESHHQQSNQILDAVTQHHESQRFPASDYNGPGLDNLSLICPSLLSLQADRGRCRAALPFPCLLRSLASSQASHTTGVVAPRVKFTRPCPTQPLRLRPTLTTHELGRPWSSSRL